MLLAGLPLSPADIDIGHISYFLPVYGGNTPGYPLNWGLNSIITNTQVKLER